MQACSGHSATTQGCNAGQRCSGSAALRLTGDVHAMKLAGEISWHLITFQICQQTMKQTIGMTLFLLNWISCLGVYKCIMFAAAPQLNNYVFEFIGVMTEIHRALWSWSHEPTTTMVHDDVIKWKHFPRYWPFVRGIHRSPVNYPHKGQWRGALMLSLICVWINGWVNTREAGDLRRHRAHYGVTVMWNPLAPLRVHMFHWTQASLTHLPLDKLSFISQMTFSNEFSFNEKFCISIQISLKFVPKSPIDNNPALRQWLGAEQAICHYPNQCIPSLPTHICDNRDRLSKCHSCIKWIPPERFPRSTFQWRHMTLCHGVLNHRQLYCLF